MFCYADKESMHRLQAAIEHRDKFLITRDSNLILWQQ